MTDTLRTDQESTNPKEQVVRDFLHYFHTETLDLAGLRACLAPDARYQPLVPISAPLNGADAICAELERQFAIYVDCACEITAIASNGDTVFTERVDRVRQLADGRETVVHVAGVFTVRADNRISFWREYWDGLDIAAQMGVTGEEMRAIMTTDG